MNLIGQGYDSQVFQVGSFCTKIYQREGRILDESILRQYHQIQTWVANIVNAENIKVKIMDGYPFNGYTASLEILPLSQDSISRRVDGVCTSILPLVEGGLIDYEHSVQDIVRNSGLSEIMQQIILMHFAAMNVRVKAVGKYHEKKLEMVITDLGARIGSYVWAFNELVSAGKVDYQLSKTSD